MIGLHLIENIVFIIIRKSDKGYLPVTFIYNT